MAFESLFGGAAEYNAFRHASSGAPIPVAFPIELLLARKA